MTDRDTELDEAAQRREWEERLAKDWGPRISRRQRLASGIVIIVAFVGLVLGALLIAP